MEGLAAGRKYSRAGFVACAILLFYTNYFVSIGLMAAILVAAPLLKPGLGFLAKLVVLYLIVEPFTLPGVFLFQILEKSGGFETARFADQATYYAGAYVTFLLPLPVLELLVFLLVLKGFAPGRMTSIQRPIAFLLALSAIYIGYLSFGPWVEFRYLTMLLPTAAILLAAATRWILGMRMSVAIALITVVIATDVLHMAPFGYLGMPGTKAADRFPIAGPINSPLLGFLFEIGHHFDAPEYVLARYLVRHARADDVVLTTYDDLPLQFYTPLRVAGGLEGRQLPDAPDWLIRRRWIMSGEPGKDNDSAVLIDRLVKSGNYEKVNLGHLDHQLGTNPDPVHHFFRNPEFGPPILMFRKISRESAGPT
jgi:hypothetical protein